MNPLLAEQYKHLIRQAPSLPGVYLFLNKKQQIIYVGKSVHLRRRISSYFNDKSGFPRLRRLLSNLAKVTWIVTHSELSALLLEDRLIKLHWPMFNVRQKDNLNYKYLVFTEEPFPRLKVTSYQDAGSRQVFGPFPDSFYVAELVNFIQQIYPLRRCEHQPVSRACLDFQLGTCAGACFGTVSRLDYMCMVDQVRKFLHGQDEGILARIQKRVGDLSALRQFEQAAKIHAQAEKYRRQAKRFRFIAAFKTGSILAWQKSEPMQAFLFLGGEVAGIWHGPSAVEKAEAAMDSVLQDEIKPDADWLLIDRGSVVYDWLLRRPADRFFRVL